MAPDKNGWIKFTDEEPPKTGAKVDLWSGVEGRITDVNWCAHHERWEHLWVNEFGEVGMIPIQEQSRLTHWRYPPPAPESTP